MDYKLVLCVAQMTDLILKKLNLTKMWCSKTYIFLFLLWQIG